jgi:predicted transcriptional regulator
MMITASQCRSARTLLSWSVGRLASSASVRERDIDDFELERCRAESGDRRRHPPHARSPGSGIPAR